MAKLALAGMAEAEESKERTGDSPKVSIRGSTAKDISPRRKN